MAIFRPEFDVSFDRGRSAFDAAVGTFMDINTREGKQAYLRQLSAASPKMVFAELRDLLRERRSMVDDLFKLRSSLGRSSGGPSFRQTMKPGDPVKAGKYMVDKEKEHKEAQADIQTGYQDVSSTDVQTVLDHIRQGQNEDARTVLLNVTETLEANERVGYGLGLLSKARELGATRDEMVAIQQAKNKARLGIQGDTARRVNLETTMEDGTLNFIEFQEPRVVTRKNEKTGKEEIVGYSSPTMSRFETKTYSDLITPTTSSTITSRGRSRPVSDNKELIALYKSRIQKIDQEIEDKRSEYEQSKSNYQRLLRGPSFNIALGASGFAPSRFGQVLSEFEQIRKADPDFAAQIQDASEKRFTVPNLYDDFETLDNASGTSPIAMLLESTQNIDRALGLQEGGRISDENVDVIVNDASRLRNLFQTPMYQNADYGVTVSYLGNEVPLGQFMDLIPNQMANERDNNRKKQMAQAYVDALRNFESSKTKDDLEAINTRIQPTSILADRIDKTVQEIQYAAQNKDTRYLRDSLNSLNRFVSETPSEIGGAGRDEVQNILEQVARTPADERNFQVTGTRLSMLSDSLRGIAANQTLGGQNYTTPDVEPVVSEPLPAGTATAVGSKAEFDERFGSRSRKSTGVTGDLNTSDGPGLRYEDIFGFGSERGRST